MWKFSHYPSHSAHPHPPSLLSLPVHFHPFVQLFATFTCIPNDQLKTLVILVRFDVLVYEHNVRSLCVFFRSTPSLFLSHRMSESLILFIIRNFFSFNHFWQIDFHDNIHLEQCHGNGLWYISSSLWFALKRPMHAKMSWHESMTPSNMTPLKEIHTCTLLPENWSQEQLHGNNKNRPAQNELVTIKS